MKIGPSGISGEAEPPQAPVLRGEARTARDAAPVPFEVRARVTITPWTDLGFARDVREVMGIVSLSDEIVLGSGNGAVLAERLLRERGYRHARVIDARTAEEALRRVAHWQVLRDGETAHSTA